MVGAMRKNERSLSIVHINTHDIAGGAAKVAWRLAETQRNAGHDSRMLVGIKESDSEHSSAFPIECDPARQSYCKEHGQLFYDCQGSHKLIANPIVKSADIVHLHNLHGGYFNPFSLSAISYLKPLVWTLHDMQSITGHCAHSFDCQRWQTGCGRCPYLNVEPAIQLDTSAQLLRDKKLIYDHSRLWLVTPSQWLKSKIERSVLQSHPVELIYNSVDTTVFRPCDRAEARKKFGVPAKALVIGAVAHGGALTNQWKGGKYTQKALEALKNKLPDHVFVNIGGDYETDDPKIINIPHINNESELARAYSTLDIFLNTSIADNCPLVILEALSCGIPIVTFDTGGIPELVCDGQQGCVTTRGDQQKLVQDLQRLALSPDLQRHYGHNARERAVSRFDCKIIYSQYENLYERILEESKAGRSQVKLFPSSEIPKIIMSRAFMESENSKLNVITPKAKPATPDADSSQTEYDVSIVLCTKDRAQLLDQMLASLSDAIQGINCEVIVVDGSSIDNTLEVLKRHGVTKIYNEAECLGPGRHSWPQLYNFGFSKARGKWAMYASDDILFSKECIVKAVKLLNSQKDEVAGGIFFFKNIHESPDEEEFGAEKFFIGLDRGWKMLLNYGLFRLDYFRQVGGLDKTYRFYCADGDLGCKFYDSGKQLIPLSRCLVIHNNVLDQLKKTNQERISSDYSLYLQRWGHFAPGEQGPGRLIWQEDFVEAFNLPFDLEKINWGIEYFWQGLACLQREMFEKALGKFSQAMRNGCCHWKVLWYSAKAAYGCGEVEVAKKIARTVVKFAPEFTQAKEFLANLSMSNSSSFLTREPKMFSHGQTSPALLNIEQFEKQINPVTWQRHDKILQWAQSCEAAPERFELPGLYENSDDPVVRQGFELTAKVKQQFRGRYKHLKDLRILVHIPSLRFSPAGYSLFTNMAQGLEFIGIPVRMLGWNETIDKLLYEFRPTVFLTSDHESYLSRINWDSVKKYRELNTLRIGLTASIEEYGNTALQGRLLWAKQQRVDFYYSFRCPEYLRRRKKYRPFFENGYNIFSVELGANPLIHYPVPGIERDLNYVFLASANSEKWPRYFSYLSEIFSKYSGFLDGPGWPFIKTKSASFSKDRYLYARAKVGLNLHLDEQINWANELNERTYILAICGVPQLVDNPKLLPQRFDENAFFVAKGPDEYTALFAYILNNPVEAREKALIAQREVFTKHTWFHRAEGLVLDLMKNYFPKSQQHGLLYNSDIHSQVNRKIRGRIARIGGSVKQLLEYKNCEVQDINLMDGGFGRVPPNSNTIIIDMHNACHEPWLMNRYDCSISSNVIEHSYNPVALLLNFYFITKKGGYQFHAIPNHLYTYDSYRKPTSLAHLIDDFEKMTDKSDTSHNEDYIQSAIIKNGWQREFHKKYPLTYPYIHFHVFDEYNTKELMEFIFQDVMIDVIKTRQFSDVLVLFRNVLNPKFVGKYRNLINQYSQRIPMSDDNVLNKIERGNHISSISEFQSEPETWSQRHQNIELPGTLLKSEKNDLRKATLESHCNTLAQLKSLNLWKEGEPIRLHLGCGGQRLDGYINIDYPPNKHTVVQQLEADCHADIEELNFPAQSIDEIRLHHVFEHFNRGKALALLVRWHEWLKVGGKLHIETPDVLSSAKMLASNVSYKIKQGILRHMFGSHEADWAYHYDGWYEHKFRRILSSLGFEVTCHTSQWQREPYLANVEVFAIKRRNMSREQLLTVCDQLLLDSKVDDIPAERNMHEIWMKDVRTLLDNTRSVQTVSVQNI